VETKPIFSCFFFSSWALMMAYCSWAYLICCSMGISSVACAALTSVGAASFIAPSWSLPTWVGGVFVGPLTGFGMVVDGALLIG